MKREFTGTIEISAEEKKQLLQFSAVSRSAHISKCGKYRYGLFRKWNDELPMVMFMMLNPSTADATKDDPTIRRCIAFAKSWGFGSLFVGNLFAYRATNPKELLTAIDPIGQFNAQWNELAAKDADMIVCAWGNSPIINALQKRYGKNYTPLSGMGELHYIELSKDGTPKHPLYLRGELKPNVYEIISSNVRI